MSHKSFNYVPSAEDSRDRRAAIAERRVKIAKAKDHDWKQELSSSNGRSASMMELLGYNKLDS